jgi:hypothetical protein
MPSVRRNAFLDRVIARVHASAQAAPSQEDYQLGAITLRMLCTLRWSAPTELKMSTFTDPVMCADLDLAGFPRLDRLDIATFAAFGCSFKTWQKRNMKRKSQLAWELAQCIPDYDPMEAKHAAMVKASQMGGQAESGRAVFEMPAEEKPTVEEPVRRVPRGATHKNAS